MSKEFVLVAMFFFHIIDDYYLQGILASLKQKKWWENKAPQKLYKYDYIMALAMHSLSWSFMIMLPLAIYSQLNISAVFLFALCTNAIIHGFVDNLKANKFKINLIADQAIHMVQIIVTFLAYMNLGMI